MGLIKKKKFNKPATYRNKRRSYSVSNNSNKVQGRNFSQKKRTEKNIQLKLYLSFFSEKLMKIFLCTLYSVFFFSSGVMLEDALSFVLDQAALTVQSIEIKNNTLVSKDELLNASGIIPGENILDYDLLSVKERVEKIEKIYSATVKRSFPGKIIINIDERQPVARLIIGGELLDKDGRYLEVKNGYYYYKHLPVMEGFNLTPFGILPKEEKVRYKKEISKINSINKELMKSAENVVKVSLEKRWTDYRLNTGITIRLPLEFDNSILERISLILSDLKKRKGNFTIVDMRFDDAVVKVKK